MTQQACVNKRFPGQYAPKTAVAAYVGQDFAHTPDCAIGQEWGYPINSWCVEKGIVFRDLFLQLSTFNEHINGWTTSQVCVT